MEINYPTYIEISEDYWCVSSVVYFEYVESNAVNTK